MSLKARLILEAKNGRSIELELDVRDLTIHMEENDTRWGHRGLGTFEEKPIVYARDDVYLPLTIDSLLMSPHRVAVLSWLEENS